MTTVRQIERRYRARQYTRLLKDLTAARPEASGRFGTEVGGAVAASAMAMVRLDELGQARTDLYATLARDVAFTRESDGGWGDPATTALCLRALHATGRHAEEVFHGLKYLANLQRDDGTWPAGPLKRLPADGWTTAFVLLHLHADGQLRAAADLAGVDLAKPAEWLDAHPKRLDDDARRLWSRVSARCRPSRLLAH